MYHFPWWYGHNNYLYIHNYISIVKYLSSSLLIAFKILNDCDGMEIIIITVIYQI